MSISKTVRFVPFAARMLFLLITAIIIFILTPLTGFVTTASYISEFLRAFLLIVSMILAIYGVFSLSMLMISEWKKNFLLFILSGAFCFLFFELVFMFIPCSYSDEHALAARLWHRIYWKENSMGFRDADYDKTSLHGKKKIFIIGDSFVAGAGIKDPDDRLSGVLQRKLPDNFYVMNLGVKGASTADEIALLDTFAIKPDILILCHYINDSEYLLPEYRFRQSREKKTLSLPEISKQTETPANKIGTVLFIYKTVKNLKNRIVTNNRIISLLTCRSYFLNFLYFSLKDQVRFFLSQLVMKKISEPELTAISEFNENSKYVLLYRDSLLFSRHLQLLHWFVEYSQKNNAPLLVVLCPKTSDLLIDYTQDVINKPISVFLKKKGVPYLHAYPFFKRLPEKERKVSRFDGHPGVKAHQLIGQALFLKLKKQKMIELR